MDYVTTTKGADEKAYRNQPGTGAVFLLSDSERVFGQVNLNGADHKIKGSVQLEDGGKYLRATVAAGDEKFQLELRFVDAKERQPNWLGTLVSKDKNYRLRAAGWNSLSKANREYIRLKAE
jgi:hypothetical protein